MTSETDETFFPEGTAGVGADNPDDASTDGAADGAEYPVLIPGEEVSNRIRQIVGR